MELPRDLQAGLDGVLAGTGVRGATAIVDRLVERYRAGGEAEQPILASAADVAAYAAYRMPATYAAVRAALSHVDRAAPGLLPRTHLDIGGGTGAAAWAAAEAFPSLEAVTVVDQVAEALGLGRRLAQRSGGALGQASWRQSRIEALEWEHADLVTISYVLGELSEDHMTSVVRGAAGVAATLVLVEPGTPAGYRRILAARAEMIDQGLTVVAPCPHQAACPIPPGRDWCHFAARIGRSAIHRRLKNAERGFEDEKFAYVAGVRTPTRRFPGRVLDRPVQRKGLVSMRVCTPDGEIVRETVSKRRGEDYRYARDTAWGDPWPPPAE